MKVSSQCITDYFLVQGIYSIHSPLGFVAISGDQEVCDTVPNGVWLGPPLNSEPFGAFASGAHNLTRQRPATLYAGERWIPYLSDKRGLECSES